MAGAHSAGSAASSRGGGGPGARTTTPRETTPVWTDTEQTLWQGSTRALARLGRRARVTWPWWLGLALLVGALVAVWRLRPAPRYEVTTVLRVSEGSLDPSGSNLSGQVLRAHVRDIAFTSEHLAIIVGKHPEAFPIAAKDPNHDPSAGLQALRDSMEFTLTENGFVEDRGPEDPPRSARITVSYKASNPDVAWNITHDLGDLLVGSTLETHQADLEREVSATAASLRRAQEELSTLIRKVPDQSDPRVKTARDRWRQAQEAATAAGLALRAAKDRQGLRFDVVDPGRKPEPTNSLDQVVPRVVISFLATLLAGALLAGAFDPRVVDADDMGIIGINVLGTVPALPASAGREEGGPRQGRV